MATGTPAHDAATSKTARRARSPQAKDHVRQALISAGRELLLASPSSPISLRGIARHAGYSSGVIYRYFADRQALFLAIRDSEMANFVDRLERECGPGDDVQARLLAIADRAFDFSRYQIAAFGMDSLFLFRLDASHAQSDMLSYDFAPGAARIHAFFELAVRSVMNTRTMTDHDVQLAVGAMMAAVTGSVLLPRGSDHGDFPDGRTIMHEMIKALIATWRKPIV